MVEKLNPQDSRQGERGKPMLWVLVASLVLLAIATVGLLAIATVGLLTWNGANSPKDYASQSQDAARREVTGSVKDRSDGTAVPGANPAPQQPVQPVQPSVNGGAAK